MLFSFKRSLKKLIGFVLVLLLNCSYLFAEILPMSNEIQINSESTGDQHWTHIASNSLGEHIVTYNEDVNGVYRAFIKRYDQVGTLINTSIFNGGSTQITIDDIAMNNNGVSVVIFSVNDNAYFQVYNRQGVSIFGGFIQLNDNDDLRYGGVGVAINDSGEAVINWMGYKYGVHNIYLRQLNVNGYWMSNRLLIDSPSSYTSDVGIDAAGDFVVTWASTINNIQTRIFTQHYYNGGSLKRTETPVYASPATRQGYPQVAVNQSTGEHVVSWTDMQTSDDPWFIYALKFDATGQGDDAAFKVSETPSTWEPYQSIVYNDTAFWITWNTLSDNNDDIFAASFFSNTSIRTPETRLNSYTAGQQRIPTIGIMPNNELVIAWESYLQDGDGWGVYLRRFID